MPTSSAPRYSRIRTTVRNRILSGEAAIGAYLPTDAELASEFEASKGTVIKALEALVDEGLIRRLRGKGSLVVSNQPQAEALEAGRPLARNVGFVFPMLDDQLAMRVIAGAERELVRRGYYPLVLSTGYDARRERETVTDLCERGIAALVLAPYGEASRATVLTALEKEVPLVLLDRDFPDLPVDAVASDNREGGYLVADLLARKGRTRIAFFTPRLAELSTVQARLEGYRRALAEHGLPNGDDVVFDKSDRGYARLASALSGPTPPDAIVATNDVLALELHTWLTDQGLTVPEDIALTGFDNLPLVQVAGFSLTTVAQQVTEMGRTAAHLALRRIHDPHVPSTRVSLPVTLVTRASSDSRPPPVKNIQESI